MKKKHKNLKDLELALVKSFLLLHILIQEIDPKVCDRSHRSKNKPKKRRAHDFI